MNHFLFMSFLKFKALTVVVILMREGVPTAQRLLQFTQLYCCTQYTLISAVLFLKFEAHAGVVTLIRRRVPTVQNLLQFQSSVTILNIFVFQLFHF